MSSLTVQTPPPRTFLSKLVSALTLATRTEVGQPMRPEPGPSAERPEYDARKSYYIATIEEAGPISSCSFIEFDGKGDYLLFNQHRDAWMRLKAMAEESKVLLVIYCHGWKNNSQSGDVLRFNAFLRQLACTGWIRKQGFRVHGVYLGWRGAAMKPDVSGEAGLAAELKKAFGQEILDPAHAQWLPRKLSVIPEQFTYWGRKSAAEHHVSGVPISRTILSLASLLRCNSSEHRHRVVLIGHSMGALMLEQSVLNAMMGHVIGDWRWQLSAAKSQVNDTTVSKERELAEERLFDLVLLLNSAAPSIYAKQMRDFLAADHSAREKAAPPLPNRPLVISVTSEADWATGKTHRIGNFLSAWSPTMQRVYNDVVRDMRGGGKSYWGVLQGYYYERTPGHNPLLITHTVEAADGGQTTASSVDCFELNLTGTGEPLRFHTSARNGAETIAARLQQQCGNSGTQAAAQSTLLQAWRLTPRSDTAVYKCTESKIRREEANYWIVRVPAEIIRDHGDIWTQQSMEMMVALWRIAEAVQPRRDIF